MKKHILFSCFSVLLFLTGLFFVTGCRHKEKKNKTVTSVENYADIAIPAGLGSPINYDPTKRYIFLAFDDAPQPPGSVNCQDIFRQEGVKASFFMVGMHAFDPLRKRLVDSANNGYPLFVVGNHSFSHGFRDKYRIFYNHPDSAVADMLHAEKVLNIKLKIARLPGMNTWAGNGKFKGPYSSRTVAKKMDSLGYTMIGWDVEWRFGKGSVPVQSVDDFINEVYRKLADETTYRHNAIVVLAHDRMFARPQYADSLRKFVEVLKSDKRNVFETLDHYPSVQERK